MRNVNDTLVYDSLEELVDSSHTAVIAVDIQNDFCHPEGHFAKAGKDISSVEAALPGMVDFVNKARHAGLRTVFLRQATLPNGASDSPAWLRFKTRDGKSPEYTLQGSWGWQLVDGLEPGPRDWVIDKFRPDGFIGTPLDLVLRAAGIETVILLGTTTEGCLESTVRAASYHDYYVVIVEEGTASPNALNHEGSMNFFRARYPVHSGDEILNAVAAAKKVKTND
uniref:cysteine hydrolase family protein n=1 Tax=Roseovarius indicus TaxID=540747 RepID=UPI003B51BBF0